MPNLWACRAFRTRCCSRISLRVCLVWDLCRDKTTSISKTKANFSIIRVVVKVELTWWPIRCWWLSCTIRCQEWREWTRYPCNNSIPWWCLKAWDLVEVWVLQRVSIILLRKIRSNSSLAGLLIQHKSKTLWPISELMVKSKTLLLWETKLPNAVEALASCYFLSQTKMKLLMQNKKYLEKIVKMATLFLTRESTSNQQMIIRVKAKVWDQPQVQDLNLWSQTQAKQFKNQILMSW